MDRYSDSLNEWKNINLQVVELYDENDSRDCDEYYSWLTLYVDEKWGEFIEYAKNNQLNLTDVKIDIEHRIRLFDEEYSEL